MDLRNLETFIKVAETKSFSRSAEALGLTQPAISKRIAALETALETTLFDRIGRSAQLTPAGRALFPRAKYIESEISSLKADLSGNGKDPSGTITIGSTPCVASNEIEPILSKFIKVFPDININLHLGTVEEVLDLLDSNSLELAICPLFENSKANIQSRLSCAEIWGCPATIAVARRHPLAQSKKITIEDLCTARAILPPLDSLASNAITEALTPNLVNTTTDIIVAARTSNFGSMKSLAAIEMGWTCLPVNQMDDTLVALEVEAFELYHSISLVRRRDRSLSKAAQAVVNALPISSSTQEPSTNDNSSNDSSLKQLDPA